MLKIAATHLNSQAVTAHCNIDCRRGRNCSLAITFDHLSIMGEFVAALGAGIRESQWKRKGRGDNETSGEVEKNLWISREH